MVVVAWIFAFILPPVVPLLLPFKTGSARFFSFFLAIVFTCIGWLPGIIFSGVLIVEWQGAESDEN